MIRYFLQTDSNIGSKKKEVTVEEYCKAERKAGFFPKLPRTDPKFMTTPATAGFSNGIITGSIRYEK